MTFVLFLVISIVLIKITWLVFKQTAVGNVRWQVWYGVIACMCIPDAVTTYTGLSKGIVVEGSLVATPLIFVFGITGGLAVQTVLLLAIAFMIGMHRGHDRFWRCMLFTGAAVKAVAVISNTLQLKQAGIW